MGIYAIARLYNFGDINGEMTGLRLYDSESESKLDVPLESVIEVLKSNKTTIENMTVKNGELCGTNGSLDRYQKIMLAQSKDGLKTVKIDKSTNCLVVINEIKLEETGETLGYTVVNCNGARKKLLLKDIVNAKKDIERNGGHLVISNGKFVEKNNKTFISSISGNYECNKISKKTIKDTEEKVGMAQIDYNNKHRIGVSLVGMASNSRIKEVDEVTGLQLDQKLMYTVEALRDIAPHYYAMYMSINCLEAEETSDFTTAGVAGDRLYFTANYLKKCALSELVFTWIHEILHIVMAHQARRAGREHRLFNYACDLYINKLIKEELNLQLGKEVEVEAVGNGRSIKVMLPEYCLYNDNVDLKNDTPESIYEELLQNMQKDKSNSDGEEKGNNSNGDGESITGGESGVDGESGNGKGQPEKTKANSVGFRGKRYYYNDSHKDLVEDGQTIKETEEEKRQKGKSYANRANQSCKNYGYGIPNGALRESIKKIIAPPVDWRRMLRNLLLKPSVNETSYIHPDRRFLGERKALPGDGPTECGELEGIKICIDTSGSISNEELSKALYQVEQLLKQYKAKGEVIYWGTEVVKVIDFNNYNDIIKEKPADGGGTDAECIFRYFESCRDYKNGKKQKPYVTIVFTDGYFAPINEKWIRKYKNVIFVLSDNSTDTSIPQKGNWKIAPLKRKSVY